MKRILFICSGNTCRSPMAQGLFTRVVDQYQGGGLKSEYQVCSAGIFAVEGMPAARAAVETMLEYKIDLSEHRAKRLEKEMINEADLVLVMTNEHYLYITETFAGSEGKTFLISDLAGYEDQEILDPYGLGIQEYKKSARQIRMMLERIIERIS